MRASRSELSQARSRDEAKAEGAETVPESERSRAELLRVALDAVPLGVVVLSPDGTELFRNHVAAALADARHDQALVAHLLDQVAQEARVKGSAESTLELRGPSPRVVEVRAQQVRLSGAGEGAVTVAVLQDVSERHRLDAVRRDFVANVSHELRTPIGALGALSEAMAEEQDPGVIRRLAGLVGAEAERAAGLVADLLDLSRVEGTGKQRFETVRVSRLVEEGLARQRPVAKERGIAIEVAASDEEMTADPGQIVSALSNLLDNAIKYSDPGSSVTLRAELDGTWVRFIVRDHGIGIPARDHERIFERFYRVDRARSRDTGGTGLGLAIVRHVALNHGGDVTVRSREGEGSEFTLRVPRWGR